MKKLYLLGCIQFIFSSNIYAAPTESIADEIDSEQYNDVEFKKKLYMM